MYSRLKQEASCFHDKKELPPLRISNIGIINYVAFNDFREEKEKKLEADGLGGH